MDQTNNIIVNSYENIYIRADWLLTHEGYPYTFHSFNISLAKELTISKEWSYERLASYTAKSLGRGIQDYHLDATVTKITTDEGDPT